MSANPALLAFLIREAGEPVSYDPPHELIHCTKGDVTTEAMIEAHGEDEARKIVSALPIEERWLSPGVLPMDIYFDG